MERSRPPREACELLLKEVLASRTFARSARLASFLETICAMMLDGRSAEISEQQIGVSVFGRPPMYNAAEDSIVRTQARLLRQRLEEYFDQENPGSDLVIVIPRGGYVPVFEPRPRPVEPEAKQVALPPVATAPPEKRSIRPLLYSIAGGLALALLLAGLFLHLRRPELADGFWDPFFGGGRPVLIVSSDDALVLLQEASRTPVSLSDYRNGSWLTQSRMPSLPGGEAGPRWFASHQYTSSADLNLALRLGRLPAAAHARVESRNARDLRLDDLKENNVVLIGGSGANPWVELFEDRLNFSVQWDWQKSCGYVQNKHPQPGEAAVYQEDPSASSPKSYGVLALLPGLDGNGEVLLFEGTGMAGTESAADFPFSDDLFAHFKRTLMRSAGASINPTLDPASGADAAHMPYFEVLLETSSLGGNAPAPRVVAFRRIDAPAGS